MSPVNLIIVMANLTWIPGYFNQAIYGQITQTMLVGGLLTKHSGLIIHLTSLLRRHLVVHVLQKVGEMPAKIRHG